MIRAFDKIISEEKYFADFIDFKINYSKVVWPLVKQTTI